MRVFPSADSDAYSAPGIFRGHIAFDGPLLSEYRWPMVEITGHWPGPRLCISAGVHVNEVSSIEAAIRLQKCFHPETLAGTVSILPVLNLPALTTYSEYVCPQDNLNINHTFPGDLNGSWSQALCHAVMTDWAKVAACHIDMHGGDLRELISFFSIWQMTNDAAFDDRARQLANCFDADFVMALTRDYMGRPGRPPTAFAERGQVSLMSEAGSVGLLDEEAIQFHVDGVLNAARLLGMIDSAASPAGRQQLACNQYVWVRTPIAGQFHSLVEPRDWVEKGTKLGEMRDFFGTVLTEINAPCAGNVLWRISHPTLSEDDAILTLAVPETFGS